MQDKEILLIAPCGINCSLCIAFQREKNRCNGCRNLENVKYKTKTSTFCIIKNCTQLKETASGFCYDRPDFPCKRLVQLDKRYSTKYNTSVIKNLNQIQKNGVEDFIKSEKIKWKCNVCKGLRCMHKINCINYYNISNDKK